MINVDLWVLLSFIEEHSTYFAYRDSLFAILRKETNAAKLDLVQVWLQEKAPLVLQSLSARAEEYKKRREKIFAALEKSQIPVCYGEALYPRAFYNMPDPPLKFSYTGASPWVLESCLSVIGSRNMTYQSEQWIDGPLREFCVQRRPVIVSGGARGVDQKAHQLALRLGLPTVVVLPAGLDKFYPSSLDAWKENILATGGCFLSEYLPNLEMRKFLFRHRNRLIAALGHSTLIVQAQAKSGTCLTAHLALEMGRPVWVVPGSAMESAYGGNLDLLRLGGAMVVDAQDLNLYFDVEMRSLNSFC